MGALSRPAMMLLGPLALATTWGVASPARADDPAPGDIAKRKRIGFDAEVFYWQGSLARIEPSGLVIRNRAVGGLGVRRVPLGFNLGFALSERVILGGRIDVAIEPEKHDEASTITLRGAIGPYLEVMFSRDRHVRPFALLRASIGRSATFVHRGDGSSIVAQTLPTFYPSAGGGLGTHVFLRDQLSFDAMVTLDYRWNLAQLGTADASVDGEVVSTGRWQLRDGTLTTAVVFGFSHWW